MFKAMCMGVVQSSKAVRPMLQSRFPLMSKFRARSIITPEQDVFNKPSMFNPQVILKFYELIPLFVITGSAVVGLGVWIVRSIITRDDVRYSKSGKMLCEVVDPENPAPVRKFRVYNQKYEVSPRLLEALKALEEPVEAEPEKKTK